jgi:hypothetical protein
MDALLAPLDQLEILALKLDKLDARLEYIASTLQVINGRLSDDSQMEILALKLDKLDAKLKGVFAMLEIIAEVPP